MANVTHSVLIVAVLFLGMVLHVSTLSSCGNGEKYSDFYPGTFDNRHGNYCNCIAGMHVRVAFDAYNNQVGEFCSNCPSGTYSAAGDHECTPCVVGSYSYAGAASCTAGVNGAIQSLDINEYLASHAPGLYSVVVIGFIGAILNSVAICAVVLWVRSLKIAAPDLKSAATHTDADAV
jgi:hypothetical protein